MERTDKLRTATLRSTAVVAVLLVGGVACSPAGDTGEPETSATEENSRPDAYVVEPLESISGAETWTTHGVQLSVPAGLETQRTEIEHVVRLVVFDPDTPVETAQMIVGGTTSGENAAASLADQTAVTQSELALGGVEDLSTTPAEWSVWPEALAIQGTLEQDGEAKTILSIQALAEDGSYTVGASVNVVESTLDDSWQYEVLRTARPAN